MQELPPEEAKSGTKISSIARTQSLGRPSPSHPYPQSNTLCELALDT